MVDLEKYKLSRFIKEKDLVFVPRHFFGLCFAALYVNSFVFSNRSGSSTITFSIASAELE